MTAPTVLRPVPAGRPEPAAEPRVRFRDLCAAEWIKLWSLPSTRRLLGIGLLVLLGFALQDSIRTYQDWPHFLPQDRAHYDPMRQALSGPGAALLMIGTGSVGALTIVGEYASGLIRTTLTAVPRRSPVVAAKAAVLAAVMLGFGAAVSLGTFGVSQAVLSGRGIGLSVGDPGVPRVLLANALLAPVAALTGLGIGALLRHTAGAVVTACAALVIVPGFCTPNVHQWVDDVYGLFPFYDWRNCLSAREPFVDPHLPSVAGSWLAFALWPLLAVLLTVLVVRRRDV
ncbi:ABC transporter permease [Kitasatospora sp. NPDC057198]|uniref:ABC transporter permease n=1 Tax=Kitasatospora sp. NPDC057198 TaxID=3346046 RepID=UPI00363B8CB3